MDLFTVDNKGETELLDVNETNCAEIVQKVVIKNVDEEEGEETAEEEDENLSDVDFGGMYIETLCQSKLSDFEEVLIVKPFRNRFTAKHHRHFTNHQIA